MQIYRKCKHYSDWCAEGVFADTWRSWGFIDAYTGEEIQPNEAYHGDYSLTNKGFILNTTYWYYKWKYDTVDSYNHFLFTNGYTTNVDTRYAWLGFNLSNKQYFTGIDYRSATMDSNYDNISNRLTYLLGQYGGWSSSTSRVSQYFNLFFIPLKNNGFFFNYESSCGAGSGNTSSRGLPIELSTYYKQTSPLLWDLYSYSHISNYSGSAMNPRTSNATIIGFYNNIDNQMNYIKLVMPDEQGRSRDTENPKTCYINWDCKKNSILTSIPCMDADGSYTDVKENICTLIKYPYETGALSNLFIISTCPERKTRQFVSPAAEAPDYVAPDSCGLEGKFFSFNGRNFYGFYNNLAVELPSN